MKGIDGITDKIISEAESKASEIVKNAEIKAEQFLEEQKDNAEKTAAEILAEGKNKACAAEEKAIKTASMDSKKEIAAKKQELIDKSFTEAFSKMLTLPEKDYKDLLTSLALSACKDGEGGELVFNSKDASALGKDVVDSVNGRLSGKKVVLSSDNADIKGGLIVKRGSIDINCSLEVIVRMLREELSLDVAGILFGKGE